jgi:hypothetical protein
MTSVRESLNVVGQSVSIRQLAQQRSLRKFVGAPPADRILTENEVEVSREYIPTEGIEKPSAKIEAVTTDLSAVISGFIQEQFPFPPSTPFLRINEP